MVIGLCEVLFPNVIADLLLLAAAIASVRLSLLPPDVIVPEMVVPSPILYSYCIFDLKLAWLHN
jgi:hypothetical protein